MMRTDVRGLSALAVFTTIFAGACAAEHLPAPLDADEDGAPELMGSLFDPDGNGDGTASGERGGVGPQTADPDFRSKDEPPTAPGEPLPEVCPEGHWCSSLYSPTWSPNDAPDSEGRFLHDFSYAGYHHGETPPTTPPGSTYDVATYGADRSGGSDATRAIQAAVNAAQAAGGGVVFFPAGSYRVDGEVFVTRSNVVLRGAGTSSVLRFPNGRGLKFEGRVTSTARRPLAVDAPNRSNEVLVANASDLAPGDDVAVGWTITPQFVAEHQMTGTWKEFNGQYQTFFRTQVVAVDTTSTPHRVVLDVPLRYQAKVRDGASLEKESGYLSEVGLEDIAITNATTWSRAWSENRTAALRMTGVKDAWVRELHSVPTPGATGQNAADKRAYHLRNSGLVIATAKRVSVLDSSLENTQNRGGGGNGYLFEFSRANELLFQDVVARNGRHNFIQNWGFGTSGTVLLRCVSEGSEVWMMENGKLVAIPAASEHHHSLAIATLIDDSRLDDGFKLENRRTWSEGAGHTATESVVWRPSGKGVVASRQFGWGYVIGAHADVNVDTRVETWTGVMSAPEDFVEGKGEGDTLYPASLYEHQRARRLQSQ